MKDKERKLRVSYMREEDESGRIRKETEVQ